MNITEKRYPYPVLRPSSDDYVGSSFDVDITASQTPDAVTLVFSPTLRDDGLRELIGAEGAAKIVCHLECPKTVYRTCVELPLPSGETAEESERKSVVIPAADLSGTVSVCPFVVASQDIPAYANSSFNPDYEGEAFTIENGAVLAEGVQKDIAIETMNETLAQSPSIFVALPGPSDCRTLRSDFEGDRIKVLMPKSMYDQYGTLKDSVEDREAIWAMVFVPALVNVLATLAAVRQYDTDGEGLAAFSDRRWYRVVDRALRREFGFGIDTDNFENGDALEFASTIIKNSVGQAFTRMAAGTAEED